MNLKDKKCVKQLVFAALVLVATAFSGFATIKASFAANFAAFLAYFVASFGSDRMQSRHSTRYCALDCACVVLLEH